MSTRHEVCSITKRIAKCELLGTVFFFRDNYWALLKESRSRNAASSWTRDGPRGQKIGEGLLTEEALWDAAQDRVLPFLALPAEPGRNLGAKQSPSHLGSLGR